MAEWRSMNARGQPSYTRSEPQLGESSGAVMLRSTANSKVAALPHVSATPLYASLASSAGMGSTFRSGTLGDTAGSISWQRLPKTVTSRLWLDAGMAPSVVDLRMNHRNLIHEMHLHQGEVVSSHCAKMRSQRRLLAPKPQAPPPELRLPGLRSTKKLQRLQAQLLRDMSSTRSTSGSLRQQGRRNAAKGTRFARFWVEDEHGPTEQSMKDAVNSAIQALESKPGSRSGHESKPASRGHESKPGSRSGLRSKPGSRAGGSGSHSPLSPLSPRSPVTNVRRTGSNWKRAATSSALQCGATEQPQRFGVRRALSTKFPDKIYGKDSVKVQAPGEVDAEEEEQEERVSTAPSEASRSSVSQEPPPETAEEQLLKAFIVPEKEAREIHGCLQGGDKLLPHMRLRRALEAIGYAVQDADLQNITVGGKSSSGLTMEEFIQVVTELAQHRQQEMLRQFKVLDADRSGSISHREFRRLLWDLGFTVTAEAAREFLDEATAGEKNGQVDMKEFCEAARLAQLQQGFMKAEVEKFFVIFAKYDVEGEGELSADELAGALGWLGTATTFAKATSLIHRFGNDGTEFLVKPEFLRVMRLRFEEEHDAIRSMFAEYDHDASGTMETEEVRELCEKLGYLLSNEVLQECMHHLHLSGDEIVYEDVIALIEVVKDREGFTRKEVEELTNVFVSNTAGDAMREFEMVNALTWLGYSMPPNRRKELWRKVDIDKSDMIEKSEFLKMMRILRDQDIQTSQNLLALCEIKHSGKLAESVVKDTLVRLGHAPETAFLRDTIRKCTDASGKANVQGVMQLLALVRDQNSKSVRMRAGLPDNRAGRVTGRFDGKLQAGKEIKQEEWMKLLGELYPREKHLAAGVNLQEIIRSVCGGDSLSTLQQAFQVTRKYGDMLEEESWKKKEALVKEADFDQFEVAMLRGAFRTADTDFSGSLSEPELLQALRSLITNMTDRQQQALTKEASELTRAARTIDFYEFLRTTSKVRDADGQKNRCSFLARNDSDKQSPFGRDP